MTFGFLIGTRCGGRIAKQDVRRIHTLVTVAHDDRLRGVRQGG